MSVLLGRDAELAATTRFLDSPEGTLWGVILEGDSGIGKTTILKEALARATQAGYLVLSCAPGQAEARQPYSALGDLIRGSGDEALTDLPDPQRRALEVALLRADAPPSGIDHRAVSLAVLGVLRTLARSTPLLLAIDDLQWMDASSARALQFAIRRLEEEPVGIMTT